MRSRYNCKSKHQGLQYPCDQCDYKATLKWTLLGHLKSKHEGIKYPCDQCDFKATHKGTLKSHMKSIHEGVNLWKHIKSKHLH